MGESSSSYKDTSFYHHGIWSHLFMANRWETLEIATDFIFLGSKVTVNGDCIHEIKRCLLLGRKAMTNLDSVLKSRDIILPAKVCIVKAMVSSTSHAQMGELGQKEG